MFSIRRGSQTETGLQAFRCNATGRPRSAGPEELEHKLLRARVAVCLHRVRAVWSDGAPYGIYIVPFVGSDGVAAVPSTSRTTQRLMHDWL